MTAARCLLIPALCALLACATAARADDGFTPAQTKALERIIHDYLVAHPEVLMEAMQAADDKEKANKQANAEKAVRARHDDLYRDPDAQVGGNPKGDVTIVEFFDYRCPYCKEMEPLIDGLLDSDRKLRIVYKEFPILGPASIYASKMALTSRAQGKYAAFHRAMMATKGKIDETVVDGVAASVGIDLVKAKVDMAAPAIDAVIRKDIALADALDVNGTPSFVVAGKVYSGAMTLDEMKKLTADARREHAE
jgi:protein-disulfide isomerase